jgi:1-acyl-sn-glycerol-3-phosphate acyltransferase
VLIGEPLPVPAMRGRAGLADATERVRVALAALVAELDRLRDETSVVSRRKVESS